MPNIPSTILLPISNWHFVNVKFLIWNNFIFRFLFLSLDNSTFCQTIWQNCSNSTGHVLSDFGNLEHFWTFRITPTHTRRYNRKMRRRWLENKLMAWNDLLILSHIGCYEKNLHILKIENFHFAKNMCTSFS